MEALLTVQGVTSHHDIKGLQKLHDSVEAYIRGLRALRVPAQTYGGLLTSVLVNKLPPELRLVVTRGMTGDVWDLDRLMTILEQEVSARECAFIPSTPRRTQPRLPTAATLVANNPGFREGQVSCVYCSQEHTSNSCTIL